MQALCISRGAIAAMLACAVAANAGARSPQSGSAPGKPSGETTTLPLPYPRSARFTTDEGTWLSLDVSPDGRMIVFDLAGDLYTLPIGGGKATRITDGPGYDCQPRFAPDGQRIVFQSDRSGSENLYTVRPNGQELRALTTGEGQGYTSPTWTPDGQYIVVARDRYGSTPGDLYLYRKGGGEGSKVTTKPSSTGTAGGGIVAGSVLGPAFGPDVRSLYFSLRDVRDAGSGIANNTKFTWKIQRYDFETGEQRDIAMAPGGALRPLLSPNGKWLAYATRRDTATSLRLRNLETQEESWLIHGVQRDDQESWSTRDVMPGSAFTPDSKAIVTAYNGKIWRVEVPSGKATMIPFTAEIDAQLGELVHFDYPINDSVLVVTQIRDPRLSPDNRRIVFTALSKLYVMDLLNGTPRRLTSSEVGEHHPVWSPDGRWIAYVTWDDSTGAVYRVRADGRGTPERLTRHGGYYRRVNYNPSGSRLVAIRADEPFWFGNNAMRSKAALVWLPAGGGDPTLITPLENNYRDAPFVPYFVNGDSTRIYIWSESFRWDGTDRRSHLATRGTFSPNGQRLFTEDRTFNGRNTLVLARTPLPRHIAVDLAPRDAPLVGRRVSGVDAEFPSWSPDGTKLTWAVGRFLFLYDVARGDSAIADSLRLAEARKQNDDSAAGSAARAAPAYEVERIEVRITVPKDRPAGVVALRNARIITMRGEEVIERGDLVVTNNRITGVGRAGSVHIPAAARVIDLEGKTIIPGFVDIHAHPHHPPEIHARQLWDYAAPLAYGVTTTRDPQTGRTDVLTYQDLVEAGEMLGPRIFSTGPGIGLHDGDFSTLESTRDALRRYADYYGTNTVKQYSVGDRKARQHFLMVAREMKLTPTLEGGADFKKNITEAIDGYAGSEHSYPITPLYRDMVEIVARSGITYTPTLLANYGGPEAREIMYQRHQGMHDDPKLRRFVPHFQLDRRFQRRQAWFADDQYVYRRLAAQAAKIVRAGGRVGLGGHGELPGLGEHWELWLLQSGGMSNHEALRCATLFGAEAIGLGKDLGSLEVGKLADLIVLDGDPLKTIRNTNTIRYVMKNGRLYDGDTLAELYPRERLAPKFYWQSDEPNTRAGIK